MQLLLGAGSQRQKKLFLPGKEEWEELITVDANEDHRPDRVMDLNYDVFPNRWTDSVDEIHAYDIIEHLGGGPGDFRAWFREWSEWWRVLKPGGHFFGISPGPRSPWIWGDPGHTRQVCAEMLLFLEQPQYDKVGTNNMSDYRFCYKADFDVLWAKDLGNHQFGYVLQAVKPSRIKNEAR